MNLEKIIAKALGNKERKREKLELNMVSVSILSVSAGLLMLGANIVFFAKDAQTFTIMNLAVALVALGVPLVYRYNRYSKFRRIEAIFPRFLHDITEGVNTGMTVTQAIRAAAKNDYGEFTPYAKEMAAKISWGIPLSRVFEDFSKKVESPGVHRIVQTINEAYKSGGKIHTVLEAVAETTREIEKIKKERSASIYSQMINGYIIYFIFLGVMVGISSFLVPAFGFGTGGTDTSLQAILPQMFRNLVIIQGIFAGLAVGKMAEGTFLAGTKHALVLTILGYSVFIFFA